MHRPAIELRLELAPKRKFLRIDETHDDDDGDEAERRDRRERGGERRIGNPRQRPDHHVLRVAGDRRHAAAIGGGGDRDQIRQRIAVERADDLQHDRRHNEADRIIDEEGGQEPGQHGHGDQEDERRAGVVDRKRAERPECARNLEVRDHDHHAEEERDGVEIDRPEGVLEAQRPKRDHRRAAEERDPRAIEPEAGNAARRDPDIGQDEDEKRRQTFACHSPAAPSTASGAPPCSVARSSRVSGMNAKKTRKAAAAAAPRARNEAE